MAPTGVHTDLDRSVVPAVLVARAAGSGCVDCKTDPSLMRRAIRGRHDRPNTKDHEGAIFSSQRCRRPAALSAAAWAADQAWISSVRTARTGRVDAVSRVMSQLWAIRSTKANWVCTSKSSMNRTGTVPRSPVWQPGQGRR